MTNLEKLYKGNMGFQSVVDNLAIWFCDETEHVGGGELYKWMLSDAKTAPYEKAREYARKKAEAGDRLAATAYVIGYCEGAGRDFEEMLADCGLGIGAEHGGKA